MDGVLCLLSEAAHTAAVLGLRHPLPAADTAPHAYRIREVIPDHDGADGERARDAEARDDRGMVRYGIKRQQPADESVENPGCDHEGDPEDEPAVWRVV